MERIFMNTENSKTSEPLRFKFKSQKFKQKHGFSQFDCLLHLEKHQFIIQQQ